MIVKKAEQAVTAISVFNLKPCFLHILSQYLHRILEDTQLSRSFNITRLIFILRM